MDSKEKTNSSERAKCPVCGRFANADAVRRHDAALEAMRETLNEQKTIQDTMAATISVYETEHDKLNSSVAGLRQQVSEKDKAVADRNAKIKALQQEIADRGNTIADLEMKLKEYDSMGFWANIKRAFTTLFNH